MGLGVFFNGRKINASLTKERDETYFKNKKIKENEMEKRTKGKEEGK